MFAHEARKLTEQAKERRKKKEREADDKTIEALLKLIKEATDREEYQIEVNPLTPGVAARLTVGTETVGPDGAKCVSVGFGYKITKPDALASLEGRPAPNPKKTWTISW
jgi:hypothetical protein